MSDKIVGKIAAIIDHKSVVINRGLNHNVDKGMKFVVRWDFPSIPDPDDSSYNLEGVYRPKGRLIVRSVFKRMSVAGILPTPADVEMPGQLSIYPQVDDSARLLDNEDMVIRVGDGVIEVREEVGE